MSKETKHQPSSHNQGLMSSDHETEKDVSNLKNDTNLQFGTTSIPAKKRNRSDSSGERNLGIASSFNLGKTERRQSKKKSRHSTILFSSIPRCQYKTCNDDESEEGSVASIDPNEKKDKRILNPYPFFFYNGKANFYQTFLCDF